VGAKSTAVDRSVPRRLSDFGATAGSSFLRALPVIESGPMLVALITALVLAASPPDTSAPPGPAKLSPSEADTTRRSIEKDRADTRQWLKGGATSYLATVARVEFMQRMRLTVGRDPSNDVRLDDPGVRPHHLSVTVLGDSFRVETLDDAARFKIKDAERRSATVGPSSINIGRFTLRLSHQRYPALIVFDPKSPRFASYKGIDYFPIDLRWRYVLPLTRNAHPDTVVILSTRGFQRRAVREGWFDFTAGTTRCRLEASRLLEPGVGEGDIAVFFRDATTGKGTYEVGRYLDPVALGDGRYVLDFNRAYNPACAYSEDYNCPIPPKTNQLKVAVRAGEKDAHYLNHAGRPGQVP
jgi:uncharacterized protein